MCNLGWLLEEGIGGLEKNLSEAIELYRRAAELGDPTGQMALGDFAERGVIAGGPAEAADWYAKAAVQGQNGAQAAWDSLRAKGSIRCVMTALGSCNEKERRYIEERRGRSSDDLDAELQGLLAKGDEAKKPAKDAWRQFQLTILSELLAGKKEEL
eukprot:gnl/TRDRNA2_/TRDRNA2_91591_c0_seq1.p1 gnl/TRDRNA2_/TRDRNA2_91591_c0~~gnl/TRDRNA2_/TRDRNA2_91591_c0_seq1.p1  ORF type:complete len:156 (+),score=48.91 gnl/TRDRNA2_/TRDRNA2_91591_c0_seq1:118-585(+)